MFSNVFIGVIYLLEYWLNMNYRVTPSCALGKQFRVYKGDVATANAEAHFPQRVWCGNRVADDQLLVGKPVRLPACQWLIPRQKHTVDNSLTVDKTARDHQIGLDGRMRARHYKCQLRAFVRARVAQIFYLQTPVEYHWASQRDLLKSVREEVRRGRWGEGGGRTSGRDCKGTKDLVGVLLLLLMFLGQQLIIFRPVVARGLKLYFSTIRC